MPLFWPRSDASGLRYDLMPLFWLRNAKKYDLLPLFWRRSDSRSAKKYDLLPLFWPRSDTPVLRGTICCRCFGLEVMPQC